MCMHTERVACTCTYICTSAIYSIINISFNWKTHEFCRLLLFSMCIMMLHVRKSYASYKIRRYIQSAMHAHFLWIIKRKQHIYLEDGRVSGLISPFLKFCSTFSYLNVWNKNKNISILRITFNGNKKFSQQVIFYT